MILSAYKNNSEKNAFNKEKTLIATVTGSLKNESSIIDPVILLDSTMEVIRHCNYIEIPDFARSYFVTGIKSVRTGLVEVSLHCDVLESFREQILANTAIIKKQESDYNLYIDDNSFKVYSDSKFKIKKFGGGFDGLHYVLMVAG